MFPSCDAVHFVTGPRSSFLSVSLCILVDNSPIPPSESIRSFDKFAL